MTIKRLFPTLWSDYATVYYLRRGWSITHASPMTYQKVAAGYWPIWHSGNWRKSWKKRRPRNDYMTASITVKTHKEGFTVLKCGRRRPINHRIVPQGGFIVLIWPSFKMSKCEIHPSIYLFSSGSEAHKQTTQHMYKDRKKDRKQLNGSLIKPKPLPPNIKRTIATKA